MRGIAIPWGKCNIFQKKKHLFNILLLKKKKKNQTLHWPAGRPPQWVDGQPVYGAGGGATTPSASGVVAATHGFSFSFFFLFFYYYFLFNFF
jgi:hypothetical protein